MNPVKAYLSAIGRKGGQKSRRKLTKAQARAMVRARTAKRNAHLTEAEARKFKYEYLRQNAPDLITT